MSIFILSCRAEAELGSPPERLTLVGHSLGAGAATVLGLLLRNEWPSLRVFAFAPPGGLLSWNGAEATRSWVETVVVGKDLVSRLGMGQLERLRAQMGAQVGVL